MILTKKQTKKDFAWKLQHHGASFVKIPMPAYLIIFCLAMVSYACQNKYACMLKYIYFFGIILDVLHIRKETCMYIFLPMVDTSRQINKHARTLNYICKTNGDICANQLDDEAKRKAPF